MDFAKIFLTFLVIALIWNFGLPLLGFSLGVTFKIIRIILIIAVLYFGRYFVKELILRIEDAKYNRDLK